MVHRSGPEFLSTKLPVVVSTLLWFFIRLELYYRTAKPGLRTNGGAEQHAKRRRGNGYGNARAHLRRCFEIA